MAYDAIVFCLCIPKDLKSEIYRTRIGALIANYAERHCSIYSGDLYLGETVPQYKVRNRQFKLPKKLAQLQSEICNGKLWNLSLSLDDTFDNPTLYAQMQPDPYQGNQPAYVLLEVPIAKLSTHFSQALELWQRIYEATDEVGFGFVDRTNLPGEYVFKVSGTLYSHFSDAWKEAIQRWKKSWGTSGDSILDVYWMNLFSSHHISRLGRATKAQELIDAGFSFQFLDNGGGRLSIPCEPLEIGSTFYETQRQILRSKLTQILM